MVLDIPKSSINVNDTEWVPDGSSTSTDSPVSPTPLISQMYDEIVPSGSLEDDASNVAIAPGVGGDVSDSQDAIGGTFAMSVSVKEVDSIPHGSLAVTSTPQVAPGSSLDWSTVDWPSSSGTWKPFLYHV